MTEEYSVGYDEGYQVGWNAAMDSIPAAPVQEPVARLQWIVNHGWILTLLSTAESLAPDIYPLFMKPQDSVIDDAFERGRQQGMKQERALWGLAKNRQEIEEDKYSAHYDGKNWHCVKQSEKQEQMAITNAMAFAFHRAINDGDLPASDLEQIKHGLAAAFANTSSPAQRKPLTDEEIMEMYNEPRSDAEMLEFARAIEAAHGIKGQA